jgi:hypothetical protein
MAETGGIDLVRASRRALGALLGMRKALNGVQEAPHPEEAAKRRTHGADPAVERQ